MLQLLKKSFPYYGKIYPVLILCIFLGLVQGGLSLVEPQIITLMVDRVINPALGKEPEYGSSIFGFVLSGFSKEDLWGMMFALTGLLLGFTAFYFLTFYIRWNVSHYFSIRADNRMRLDIMRKINSFGPSVLKDYSTGDLITIVNSDSGKIRDFHIATIPFMADSIFYIIIAMYFLSRISIGLMLLPFLTFAVFGLITRGLLKLFNQLYDEIWKKNSELNTETQESIYGIRTIKAYGREAMRKKRFNRRSEDVRDFVTGFGIRRARYMLAFDVSDQIVMVLSMLLSIFLASRFAMTSGEYTSFLVYMLDICGYFIDFIFLASDMQDEKVSMKRLFGLLEKEDKVLVSYGTKTVSGTPHIRLKNLSVYADGKEDNKLVDSVDLDIPYGKKVGIMGPTGCGKSVLLKVLQAFREYDEGELLIDGLSSKEYDRGEIARAYGYAMQDVFLFSNSIEANIAYYNPQAAEEEVRQCGRIAEVDEFAETLPDGYKTLIGEKGFGLSGGQKQRVAIARALLKNAPVTVLDDCTSALDIETESRIFKNLSQHFQEKTLIMATHRAKALKDFDEILFMEDGKVVERGTFSELMAQDGRYANIYRQQMDKEVYVSE